MVDDVIHSREIVFLGLADIMFFYFDLLLRDLGS